MHVNKNGGKSHRLIVGYQLASYNSVLHAMYLDGTVCFNLSTLVACTNLCNLVFINGAHALVFESPNYSLKTEQPHNV